MASRDRHQKASDLDALGPHPFATKAPFAEVFPSVTTATIDVTEHDYSREWPTRMTEKTVRDFVDCSNSVCYGGGVAIGPILREMVREGKTDTEVSKLCRGYEGSPKGRKRTRDCLHGFTVRVHLNYAEA